MWYGPPRQMPLGASGVHGDAAWRAGCAGPQWDEMEATMHGRISAMAARFSAAIVASIAVVGVTAATATASPAGGGHSTAASGARALGKFAKPEKWSYTFKGLEAGQWYGPVECKGKHESNEKKGYPGTETGAAGTWRSARARPANRLNWSNPANMSRLAATSPGAIRLGLGRPCAGQPGIEKLRIHGCGQRQVVQDRRVLLVVSDGDRCGRVARLRFGVPRICGALRT